MLGTSFIYGIQTVVLVLVAGEVLEAGADGVGFFYAALGIGGVLGAAIVSRLAHAGRASARFSTPLAAHRRCRWPRWRSPRPPGPRSRSS